MKPSLRDLAILFTILALGLLIAGIVVLTHAPKDMVKAKTTEKEARCSCVPVKEDLPHRSDPHPRYCGRDVIKQTTTGCPDWAIYFVCRTTTWPDHDILWTKHFEFGDVTSLTKVEDAIASNGGKFLTPCYVYVDKQQKPVKAEVEPERGPSGTLIGALLIVFAALSAALPCYFVYTRRAGYIAKKLDNVEHRFMDFNINEDDASLELPAYGTFRG